MYITLSGLPGSGKSTITRELHKALGWPLINAGAIFRSQAKKRRVSLEDFGAYLAKHPEKDKAIDLAVITFAKKHKNAILEGRVAGWLAKKKHLPALTVWLAAPLSVRVARVGGRDGTSAKKAAADIRAREAAERERYKKMYGLDIRNRSYYDMVIHTDKLTPEEITAKIIQKLTRSVIASEAFSRERSVAGGNPNLEL